MIRHTGSSAGYPANDQGLPDGKSLADDLEPFQIRTRLAGHGSYASGREQSEHASAVEDAGISMQSTGGYDGHGSGALSGGRGGSSYISKKEHAFVPSADFFKPGASGLLHGQVTSPSL